MGIFSFRKKNEFEIGKYISWKESILLIFKIVGFDDNGTKVDIDGNVKARNLFKPYGYLNVSNPLFPDELKLPIVHKDDFYLIEGIFTNPKLDSLISSFDLLVVYRPKEITESGTAGFHHNLHYSITPKGTIDSFFQKYGIEKPEQIIENIFIRFSWDSIQVEKNLNPII
jgi:hypothetical protein